MRLTSSDGIRIRPIDSRVIDAIYKKLAAYEDAEERGLLVHLPCKVGDEFEGEDVAPVRHLNADDVYEPFYQWLGEESVSRKWETLRELIDALVESCGAKMDEEGKE